MEGPFIGRLDDLVGALERRLDRRRLHILGRAAALDDLGVANVVVEFLLLGEGGLHIRPGHLELARGLDGVPFPGGDDAEHGLFPDHFRAGNILDRTLIHRRGHSARHGREDQARMQHARRLDVAHIVRRAQQFPLDVAARHGLAHDLVALGILELGAGLHGQAIADLAVPLDFRVEPAAADQLAIAGLFRGVALRRNHAIGDGEIIDRQAEFLGGQFQHDQTRFGGGVAQGGAALPHAAGAGGAALIEARGGVARQNDDLLGGKVEFFGDHLRDADIRALTHIHLAEIGHGRTVGPDGDIGGEFRGLERRALLQAEGGGGGLFTGHQDRNGEGAGRTEEMTAIDGRVHGCLSSGQGGAANGAHDGDMGGAAAFQAGEGLFNLCVGGLGSLLQQGDGGHDPAVHAVAALGHFLGDEGRLHLVRLAVLHEATHGHDLGAAKGVDRGDAGAHRLTIDQHRTGAALGEAAAEFRIAKAKIVA